MSVATVIFIPEGTQNRYAMRAVINYCQQEYNFLFNKQPRVYDFHHIHAAVFVFRINTDNKVSVKKRIFVL